MNRLSRKRPPRNAGAFLGPDLLVPAPMRTLADDYHDVATELEDSDGAPESEPPGRLGRILRVLLGQRGSTKGG